ncbi:MAG: nucleotide exchange factor GrpE [Opitutus sp.]|nr:nucleotide exchange factor GrpE [Opitutus sp.]
MPEPETNDPLPTSTATSDAATENASDSASKGGKDPSPAVPAPGAELAAAKTEAAANLDRYLRVAADLENFRRRTLREKDELRTHATGRVLEDVLPVLDNLSLALTAAKQPGGDVKSLVGGIEIVLTQLKSALAGHGLKEINPLGQAFDPHQHESISHLPSPDVKEEHILTVVRTGYSLNGRLLRPASVVVSSGAAQSDKK